MDHQIAMLQQQLLQAQAAQEVQRAQAAQQGRAAPHPGYEPQLPRHRQRLPLQQGTYGAPAYEFQEETIPVAALAGNLLANKDSIAQLLTACGVYRIPVEAADSLHMSSAAIHADVDRRMGLASSQAVAAYKRSIHPASIGHRPAHPGGGRPQAMDRATAFEARGKTPASGEQDRAGTSQSALDPKPPSLPSRFGGRGGRGGRGGMRSVSWNLRVAPRVSSVLPREKVVHMRPLARR